MSVLPMLPTLPGEDSGPPVTSCQMTARALHFVAWAFLLPALVLISLSVLVPALMALVMSLAPPARRQRVLRFVGLANLQRLVSTRWCGGF